MTYNARGALSIYTKVLAWGGSALLIALLWSDRRWMEQPWITLFMLGAIIALRRGQIPLSKFSYLTQVGVVVLVGAVTVGPGPVAFALGIGIFTCDAFLLRKMLMASWINAGREVIGFVAAYGAYAFVFHFTSPSGVSLEYLPSAVTLAGMYFFFTRALFYFTLLVRGKLEAHEGLMILRYEILAYLLTLIAAVVSGGAIMALPPEGWITVLAVLGVLGLLTKRILEEAIAAEELNKIALRERIITSNLTLGDAFTQLEKLANRVLDWGDFRIYRLREEQPVLVYRGALGWEGRGDPPFDSAALRAIAIRTGEPVVVVDSRRDERIMAPSAAALSMMVLPLRFGNETIGTFEVDHHKTRTYGKKEIAAASTFAAQLATAIHIADLRRPLVETVDGTGRADSCAGRDGRSAPRCCRRNRGRGTADSRWRGGAGTAGSPRPRGDREPVEPGARGGRSRRRRGRRLRPCRERGDAQSGIDSGRDPAAGSTAQLRVRHRGTGWRAVPGDEPADRLHRDDQGDRRPYQPHRPQRRDRGGPRRATGEGIRRRRRRGAAARGPER